ncbi:hypothetical protein STCU_04172 [Strigomonas culicis]|uniref:Uncharacterized protein n=1 Tax=Strigomonas culicis TaxID=28005 RepID=S9UHE0_9TRYP|nr:hypothetical protein STCU_04172 [Strigomonas culicis]|eukprot:EPY30227.1 hypothetical protein STCU_04172 [Strigomonas culicis]
MVHVHALLRRGRQAEGLPRGRRQLVLRAVEVDRQRRHQRHRAVLLLRKEVRRRHAVRAVGPRRRVALQRGATVALHGRPLALRGPPRDGDAVRAEVRGQLNERAEVEEAPERLRHRVVLPLRLQEVGRVVAQLLRGHLRQLRLARAVLLLAVDDRLVLLQHECVPLALFVVPQPQEAAPRAQLAGGAVEEEVFVQLLGEVGLRVLRRIRGKGRVRVRAQAAALGRLAALRDDALEVVAHLLVAVDVRDAHLDVLHVVRLGVRVALHAHVLRELALRAGVVADAAALQKGPQLQHDVIQRQVDAGHLQLVALAEGEERAVHLKSQGLAHLQLRRGQPRALVLRQADKVIHLPRSHVAADAAELPAHLLHAAAARPVGRAAAARAVRRGEPAGGVAQLRVVLRVRVGRRAGGGARVLHILPRHLPQAVQQLQHLAVRVAAGALRVGVRLEHLEHGRDAGEQLLHHRRGQLLLLQEKAHLLPAVDGVLLFEDELAAGARQQLRGGAAAATGSSTADAAAAAGRGRRAERPQEGHVGGVHCRRIGSDGFRRGDEAALLRDEGGADRVRLDARHAQPQHGLLLAEGVAGEVEEVVAVGLLREEQVLQGADQLRVVRHIVQHHLDF